MGCLKKLALLGGLAVWYAFTGPSSEQIKNKKPYPLPEEISVVETSLPYEERDIVTESIDQDGNKTTSVVGLEKVVKTSDIDFSEEFYIQTDR